MKFTVALALIVACNSAEEGRKLRRHSRKPKYDICGKKNYKKDVPKMSGPVTSQQMLFENGVISKIPTNLCAAGTGKNVILVIGDGMGWEMARAGAIAKRVIDELTGLGVDIKTGATGALADAAKAAFAGRELKDYYLEGMSLNHKILHSFLFLPELKYFLLHFKARVLVCPSRLFLDSDW
jgi:hypothetical protein